MIYWGKEFFKCPKVFSEQIYFAMMKRFDFSADKAREKLYSGVTDCRYRARNYLRVRKFQVKFKNFSQIFLLFTGSRDATQG